VVAKALKPIDVLIVTAVNGEEGIQKAVTEKPDLILLDVTMPVMDGIETLTRLKQLPGVKDIPVVMLSADGGNESVQRATELGALRFITKPFTAEALLSGISEHLGLSKPA
jgi:CheY-like chemotaxis protein